VAVNFEKALLLKANLIITTDLTKIKTIEMFRKLGIEVLVFKNPENYKEICSQFIQLGERIGKRDFAENLIKKSDERLKELTEEADGRLENGKKMFMQLGANPLFAVVPGTFMNDLVEFSGYSNIANNVNVGAVNKEYVLIQNPDVIIIVLMGSLGIEEKENWQKFTHLSAVKNNRIFMLNADNACSPTPVTFLDAFEELMILLNRTE